MLNRRTFLASASALSCLPPFPVLAQSGRPQSYVDGTGVWRWKSAQEVALFGVNYNLASASAFRFAKETGIPFERIVEMDLAHLRRLGFDALRLSFWGDWENSTRNGSFVSNEHSHVLDFIVQRAGEMGFHCLLTPIVTYDASWPDAMNRPRSGISAAFKKEDLGRDPRAIAAQRRYWRELLDRRNPRTGRRYADEPAIAAVELINEPRHHSEDRELSIQYINSLAETVRSAGFAGPIFYNVTEDMKIAPAIAGSEVQGATFAWYPTGLQNGHSVEGNGLLLVERYEQFKVPELSRRAKLVYEFDAPDTLASYFYPAMVRSFREGGAQFATMFAYDSLPIARSNSEFNDHFLNLVATPPKAISALIAARAMRELPLALDVSKGALRERFGAIRVDDRQDLSELIDERRYFHSNDTQTPAKSPETLVELAGVGSSPLITYDGAGAWFLDRITAGVWRLEVHPDVGVIDNPFGFRRPSRPAVRIVNRSRRMQIRLPDLGGQFLIGDKGGRAKRALNGGFDIRPGVYRLSREHNSAAIDWTYFTLPGEQFEPVIVHKPPASRTAGRQWTLTAEVVAPAVPQSVILHVRKQAGGFEQIAMNAGSRFHYTATVPADLLKPGELLYLISADGADGYALDPHVDGTRPGDWDFPRTAGHRVPILSSDAPLHLLDVERHRNAILVPYGGYSANPSIKIGPDVEGEPAIRISAAGLQDAIEGDLPAQRSWNGPIDDEGRNLSTLEAVELLAGTASVDPLTILIFLIEHDGTAWGAPVTISGPMQTRRIALSDLRAMQAAMLPRDFPRGINPYFLRKRPERGGPRDKVHVEELQAVQVSLRRGVQGANPDPSAVAEVRRVSLVV